MEPTSGNGGGAGGPSAGAAGARGRRRGAPTDPTPGPAGRLQTFAMPDAGEGLTEAEVLDWRVQVGDLVTVNQVMVEIETAKAAVELPSPFAGRVHALLVQPGVSVAVGTPIITIDTDPEAGDLPASSDSETVSATGNAAADSGGGGVVGGPADGAGGSSGEDAGARTARQPGGAKIGEVAADGRIATLVGYTSAAGPTSRRPRRADAAVVGPVAGLPTDPSSLPAESSPPAESSLPAASSLPAESSRQIGPSADPEPDRSAPLAAPPVRKLARDLGVDLTTVTPSSADGVISRSDVTLAAGHPVTTGERPTGAVPGRADHLVPVRGIRKLTAAAMVNSAFTAPHVTEFLTVDVTPMMELRDRLRRRPEFADVKLTPLVFAARAVCLAVRRTPEINATYQPSDGAGDDQILIKGAVTLGIAAATPRGLVVPVIRDAGQLGLADLGVALQELTATARAGRTSPADLAGGSITITNVGVFGVDTGTPIINPGESAILALGSVKDAPSVVDGQLAVRKVCQLALSFDHRVVDGQQGSQFLADVGALLADPGLALAF